MLRFTNLAGIAICFIAAGYLTAFADVPMHSTRLDTIVRPTAQEIQLRLDPKDSVFAGETDISLTSNKPVSAVTLHAQDITVDSARFLIAGKPSGGKAEKQGDEQVVITSSVPMTGKNPSLHLWFHGPFNRQAVGLYKVMVDTDAYLFTQFEEKDARRAFPCFDQPNFKIPYALTLTIPTSLMGIANTQIADSAVNGLWKRLRFRPTLPLPSYLVAICVGPFDVAPVPNTRVPIRVISPRGGREMSGLAVAYAKPIFDWLEHYFQIPYPYDKLDLIAVPEFWAGAMENAGAITYRESVLLMDSARATAGQKSSLIIDHAHEMAHQWFGDLVTMYWWDDLWLNESFADWLSYACGEALYPEMNFSGDRVDELEFPRRTDMTPQAIAIRPEHVSDENLLSNIGSVYNKGKAILSMFEAYLGREQFRRGITAYLNKHALGSATSEDLWGSLSAVSGQDMRTVMGPWVLQPGLPEIRVDSTAAEIVFLSQRPARNVYVEWGADSMASIQRSWPTPVTLQYDSSGVRTSRTQLVGLSGHINLPGYRRDSWVYPTVAGQNYYRWSLAEPVAASLRTASNRLTPNEKLEWIYNLRAQLNTGSLRGDAYLTALSAISADTSLTVSIRALESMNGLLGECFERKTLDSLKAWLGARFVPARDKLGILPSPGESVEQGQLRNGLLAVLKEDVKDSSTIAVLAGLGKDFFERGDRKYPGLIRRALATYLEHTTLFDSCVARFERAKSPSDRSIYLSALSSFNNRALSDRALAYTLTSNIRPQELLNIPQSLSDAEWLPEDYALNWVMNHYEEITKRVPPEAFDNPLRMVDPCSPARLEPVAKFFASQTDKSEYIGPSLARTQARVATCSRLRAAQAPIVRQWLNEQGAFAAH